MTIRGSDSSCSSSSSRALVISLEGLIAQWEQELQTLRASAELCQQNHDFMRGYGIYRAIDALQIVVDRLAVLLVETRAQPQEKKAVTRSETPAGIAGQPAAATPECHPSMP